MNYVDLHHARMNFAEKLGNVTNIKELKMNPDTNKFEELREITKESNQLEKVYKEMTGQLIRPNGEPIPKHWTQFRIGELVVIKNYTFKVAYIGETSILFEPVGIAEIKNET